MSTTPVRHRRASVPHQHAIAARHPSTPSPRSRTPLHTLGKASWRRTTTARTRSTGIVSSCSSCLDGCLFSIFLPVAYFCLGFCGGGAFLLRFRAARPRSLACNFDAAAVSSASMMGGWGHAGAGAGAFGGGGAGFSTTTLRFGTGFGFGFGWLRGRVVCTCRTSARPTSSQGEGPSTACVRRSTLAFIAALSCSMAAAAAGSKHCRSCARQSLMDGGFASSLAAAARHGLCRRARPAALEALAQGRAWSCAGAT